MMDFFRPYGESIGDPMFKKIVYSIWTEDVGEWSYLFSEREEAEQIMREYCEDNNLDESFAKVVERKVK